MTQLTSPSSDELMQLPAVPRRRNSASARADDTDKKGTPRHFVSGKLADSAKRKRESARARRKSKHVENVHSDADEDDEDASEPSLLVRRASRGSRRTLQRKISDDDDDDDDDDVDDDEVEDQVMESMNSESESPRPTKRKRMSTMKGERTSDSYDSSSSPVKVGKSKKKSSSGSGASGASGSESKADDEGTDELGMPGRNDILAQLEKEAVKEGSDEFDSDDSEIEKVPKKKPERLTSRQRALQGEKVKLEYSKLESPKSKKTPVEEEWSQDEEMELKRQQKARLRQMINEKRNKEKRAAMVDKVLRGVTSKRKKITMASEARAAQAGTRLTQNAARDGCIRFISNQGGISLSLPRESSEPSYLKNSIKASYPRACTRDPRTGKRVFVEA